MKNYNLSISIPAFGYPDALKKNIDNLLSINRDDVEIVVVDNDPTGKQIGDYIEEIRDDRLHYYRNERNIGRSANIAKAIEKALASHVLIASCDDDIQTETIDYLIDIIQQHNDCGIIMGKVVTDRGSIYGYNGSYKVFKKGFEALSVTPRMGVLFPFVVKKEYLDFEKLYSQEETYMQTRIALNASGKGDFIGIENVIAKAVDQVTYKEENSLEYYNSINWDDEAFKLWSIEKCYFSPEERTHQLKRDIETIEQFGLRMSHLIKLIDTYVSSSLYLSLRYIPSSHDPWNVKNGGSVGLLGCDDVLGTFRSQMMDFFRLREKKKMYYYTGRIRDRIENERIILTEAEEILKSIHDEKEVAIIGNDDATKKLKGILGYIGVRITEDIQDHIVLVSMVLDEELKNELLAKGAKDVLFMDWMGQYLTIVWCSGLKKEEWGNYSDFT